MTLLFADPWNGRMSASGEYLEVIDGRIALSKTRPYRLGRLRERLLRQPVRPDTHGLLAKRDHVIAILTAHDAAHEDPNGR